MRSHFEPNWLVDMVVRHLSDIILYQMFHFICQIYEPNINSHTTGGKHFRWNFMEEKYTHVFDAQTLNISNTQ